jgi:hypothetical protein
VGTTRLRTNSLNFWTLIGPDRDFDVAVHVVEHADAQVAGEALVDELHGGHAPTHDAFLGRQVVVPDPARVLFACSCSSSPSPVTPLSRASTSSWERKSWAMTDTPLLHDELVEQHGKHRPVVFRRLRLFFFFGVGA